MTSTQLVNGAFIAETAGPPIAVNLPPAGIKQLAAYGVQNRRTARTVSIHSTDRDDVPQRLAKAAAEGLAALLNNQEQGTPATSTPDEIAAGLVDLGCDAESAAVVASKLGAISSAVKPAAEQQQPRRLAEMITTSLAVMNLFNENL